MRTIELERSLDIEYMSICALSFAIIMVVAIIMAITKDVVNHLAELKTQEALQKYQEALTDRGFLVSKYGSISPRSVLNIPPKDIIRIYEYYRRTHDRETNQTGSGRKGL